jgi:hypothetical protein
MFTCVSVYVSVKVCMDVWIATKAYDSVGGLLADTAEGSYVCLCLYVCLCVHTYNLCFKF